MQRERREKSHRQQGKRQGSDGDWLFMAVSWVEMCQVSVTQSQNRLLVTALQI